MMPRAAFGGDDFGHLAEALGAKSRSHADGLRKHGRGTGSGDAVEGFIPPDVGRNVQAGDRRIATGELAEFLLDGHCVEERLSALFKGLAGIEPEGVLWCGVH